MTGANNKASEKRARGRPRLGVGLVRRIQISLPEDLAEKFMALGGSRWLRRKLAEHPPVEIREKDRLSGEEGWEQKGPDDEHLGRESPC